jgi:putative flippase GtrA
MPELSLSDIGQISRDVRREEISFSHLADELIDHICCDVEGKMRGGMSFGDAYRSVKEKLGHGRLREIQKETLYAVDTKYRNMKNTMKITGIAGTVLLGFAALFKIMHWPAAGIMMSLGGLLLAFVFMPSALGVLWKETHNKKKLFLYISAFLAAMFFTMGVVFKVQHWPGAAIILSLSALCGVLLFIPALLATLLKDQEKKSKRLLYIVGATGLTAYILGLLCKIQHWPMAAALLMAGVVILFIIAFPWYTRLTWKDDRNISARFIFMIVGSMALLIPGLLINLSLQRNYDAGFFREQNEQQALFQYMYMNNQSLISQSNDTAVLPVMKEISSKTNDLLQVINSTEAYLIAEAEGEPGVPAVLTSQISTTETGSVIEFTELDRPFHPGPFSNFLREDSGLHTELTAALGQYSDFLSGLLSADDFKICSGLLEPSAYLPEIKDETRRVSLMTGLHVLELMKNGILTAESYALSTVSKLNNQ